MLVLMLVPALGLVGLGTWIWAGSLDWIGTLGPWTRVAESGRAVLDAAAGPAAEDPVLAAALARHREELSESLVLARRWVFIGERFAAVLPAFAIGLAVVLAGIALLASRLLARDLARPIRELVVWAERLAREEALPAPQAAERKEVAEVRVLRAAFRRAADELATARRRALEAERIRVWGELARRVAHEMKNPLTPLRLAAHRLARSSMESPSLDEPVAVIIEETGRLEELARQFAALGRPPDGPTSAVDLRELIASLLETDVPPTVEAVLDAPTGQPLVEGHYEALVRAFRNLIRNAVESMEGMEGPRVVEVRIHTVEGPDGRWMEVRIADRGIGLPEGADERIFEPDFTTKTRGTGLGLALVHQAVAAHRGVVRAVNRPEGGAEFVVRIPVAQEPSMAVSG